MGPGGSRAVSSTGGQQERSDRDHSDRGSKVSSARIRSYYYRADCMVEAVKTLVCPHCHTEVPANANVCRGCGAEIVRGLSRRARSIVGLAFIALAILIANESFRAYEIAQGHPFMRS